MLGGETEARPAPRFVTVDFLRMLPLPIATRIALAATLFFVVCGSSGVAELVRIGSPLRWAALATFAVLAVLWAVAERASVGEGLRVGRAALLLSALAFFSVAWSIAPVYTLERGVAFAAVAIGATAAVVAARARDESIEALGETVVVTTLLICLTGVLVYVANPAIAAEPGHLGTGFRFSGLGQSPNTIPMLAALAACLAAWLAFVRGRRGRILHALAFVAFSAEVAASGSRGAAIAVVVGTLVFALGVPVEGGRRRAAMIALALAAGASVIVANRLIQNLTDVPIPPPAPASTSPEARTAAKPPPFPRPVLPDFSGEIGTVPNGPRTFFFDDGRTEALREAFVEGSERPILGFGFGTEVRAFVERAAQFQSSRPEDSYLGLYLELGAAGVFAWLFAGALAVWAVVRTRKLPPRRRIAVAGLVAAVAAGFALGIGESYVYSAGNVATVTFWLAAAGAVALGFPPQHGVPWRGLIAATVVLVAAVPLGVWESGHARASQNAGIRVVWERLGSRLDARQLDGFRRDPPLSCLLYAAGGSPGGYELCFEDGRLVEAIDRRSGRFSAWTLQQWGPGAATLRVSPAAVEATMRRLGAYDPGVSLGPGYQARNVR